MDKEACLHPVAPYAPLLPWPPISDDRITKESPELVATRRTVLWKCTTEFQQ